MKIFKIFALAILSIAIIGCNEDDDIVPNDCSTLVDNPWSLTIFSGGWLGLWEFEEGDVVWQFYEGDSLVVSVNDSIVMIPELMPYLHEGVFDYEIISEDSISINYPGVGWSTDYAYSLTEGELIISDAPEVDGIQYIFSCE
jgi:hypothetical protein